MYEHIQGIIDVGDVLSRITTQETRDNKAIFYNVSDYHSTVCKNRQCKVDLMRVDDVENLTASSCLATYLSSLGTV